MDRDSKREYMARAGTLAAIIVAHGLIVSALLNHMKTMRSANLPPSILVTIVEKPRRPPVDLRLATLKLNRLNPIPLTEPMPQVAVPIYADPPPGLQVLESEQTASNASGVASNTIGTASEGSGSGAKTLGGGLNSIPVIHSVPPTYPPASASAREQGYVVVQVLVDTRGHARRVAVVRSSGFWRLDQSTVTAIRQWRFAPTKGSAGPEARTTISMEFELSPPNLTVPLIVMPFDPAMARRIQLAATPEIGTDVPTPPSAGALDQLIKKIQSFELSVNSPRGPRPPIRELASWGAVTSIHFMGKRSQGLDIEFEEHIPLYPRNMENIHWEQYEVNQLRGASEWLIAVSPDGAIKDAQAMICAPAQDSAISCPWH